MISVAVTISPDLKIVGVAIQGVVNNRAGLNAVLAERLALELQDHFRAKNAEPNKRGWSKTGFWAQLARVTEVESVTAAGATVTVADHRFAIHLYGGTIKPTGERKFLSISLVEEARGLNPSSYEHKTGRELFTIGHVKLLFEKRDNGGTSSLTEATEGRRKGGSSIPLAARQQLRPVYALAREANVKADPTAMPEPAVLEAALSEEASDFLEREFRKGTNPS